MVYGMQDNVEATKFKWFSKALFPALMAVNFAILLAVNPSIAKTVAPLNTWGI